MFDRMTNDFIRRLRFQTKHPYITLTKVISLIQTDTVRNKMHSLHNTIMDHQTVTSVSWLFSCKVIKCKLGKGTQILQYNLAA